MNEHLRPVTPWRLRRAAPSGPGAEARRRRLEQCLHQQDPGRRRSHGSTRLVIAKWRTSTAERQERSKPRKTDLARRRTSPAAQSNPWSGLRILDRHVLLASRTEAPGDDQSIIASPQTEVASGQSINDDEQRDEPGRRENIFTPRTGMLPSVYASPLRSGRTWLRKG